MNKPAVTTEAFQRSHMTKPRGNGGWAFQRSTRRTAFEAERFGEVEFFFGTFTDARAQAVASMADAPFVAVMP
jgi:hypothetical protein